jgi:long-chain-fatty-acid--CoA ligase ACSBG
MADEKKGPNRIKPSTNFYSIDPKECVKIRIGDDEVSGREPTSVPGLLARTTRDYPDHAAIGFKNKNNEWETITYTQYKERIETLAKVFIKLGLEERHAVGILAYNSPEWFYSELAAIHAGGIATGIYTTNSADAVLHVLKSSNSNIVVVDDAKQMAKIKQIRADCPKLKVVIQTLPPYESDLTKEDGYFKWEDIVELMEQVEDQKEEYQRRLENIAINDCCCLIYTSGTVGVPKGVMLNHDNLTWEAGTIGRRLEGIQYGKEVLVSYLPLSHVAAQMVDIYLSIQFAATIYFADRDALKGSLVKTFTEIRPTRFLGVPRVFEKIHEKMLQVSSQLTGLKRYVADWAKDVTLQYYMNRIDGNPTSSWQYSLARSMVLHRVKKTLGLDRCLTLANGAAPISAEVKKYFISLDLPLMEAFGMSECSGAHTFTLQQEYNFDTIGKAMLGSETKFINKDENGQGELLMKGRHIFMGYINELEKTKEALDEDGYIHSGDLGYIDDKGFIYITGRLKELIITAGGENIPPVLIEQLIKKELPGLSQAFLIGDKRKFLSLLVTIKTDINPDSGEARDELTHESREWVKSLGLSYTKLSEIIAAGPCPIVYKSIEDGIIRANKNATSNAQKVQKFAILPHDFTVPTGELGPTLKVKRNVVVNKYHDIIENLYK